MKKSIFKTILLLVFLASIAVNISIQRTNTDSKPELSIKNIEALAIKDPPGTIYCSESCSIAPEDVCVKCRDGGGCDCFLDENESSPMATPC